MPPEDDKFKKHIQRLEELKDLLVQSGFIVQHGHTEHREGATFTPKGLAVISAIFELDKAVGPLSQNDRAILWAYFFEHGKKRQGDNA